MIDTKNHISQTSKLNAKSWSLEAWATCLGAKKDDGTAVDACAGCYARGGFYRFGVVKQARIDNREAWRAEAWIATMVEALKKQSLFRWFDSGDLYHADLAEKVYQVILQTPHVQHWLPTRAYKIKRVRLVLEKIKQLPNVAVRYSSDSINGEFTEGLHGSTIVRTQTEAPTGVFVCEAYTRDGKCGDCSACYNPSVPVIGYVAHGKTMQKLVTIDRKKAA